MRFLLLLLCSSSSVLVSSSVLAAPQPPPRLTEEWKLDVVHRTKGRAPFHGLVIEETADDLTMKIVARKPGLPTIVLRERIPRADVARCELLSPPERKELATRLDKLESERRILLAQIQLWNGGRAELTPDDAVSLTTVPWGKDGKDTALEYRSTQFRLVSNAREDIVQLTAIQLEQVFAAYLRCLPPRVKAPRPPTIVLTRSVEEYHAIVKQKGTNILNPAFYHPASNEVVCGSNLEQLSKELESVKIKHEKMRADLQNRRATLQRVYNRQVPTELLRPIDDAFALLQRADQNNAEVFRKSHGELIQRLFHESFHAYLTSSVFGEQTLQVPPWLDEGLAQVFETALVEGGELRVGHADPQRRDRAREALRKGTLLSLKDLLQARPQKFQVAHTRDRQVSDQYYLTAWALALYLTFEKPTLGTEALDDYLRALYRGTDPLVAFRDLVQQPLDDFEKAFHVYLRHLREDGTSAAMR